MTLIVTALILLISCGPVPATSVDAIPPGLWGGKGIEMKVTADGAKVDFGCNFGTIDEALRTDARGSFSVRGTVTFGTGGPRSPDAPQPKPHEARYTGKRNGDQIELRVSLPSLGRELGPFTVRHKQPGELERCG